MGSRFAGSSRDGNEQAIAKELEALGRGITVQPITGGRAYKGSTLPNAGTPDLIVGIDGRTVLMEVKNMDVTSGGGAKGYVPVNEREPFASVIDRVIGFFGLTKGFAIIRRTKRKQLEWWTAWNGGPVHVVTCTRDARIVLGICLSCNKDTYSPAHAYCEMCDDASFTHVDE